MKKNKKVEWRQIHERAAGIDVGAGCHYVCAGSPEICEVRRFGTFTADLNSLADWLIDRKVTTVAMESTGVYWVNLYDVLEARGIEVCLANAYYVKNVPGRKSDVNDCQWIWQLHCYGLLSGSFIADEKTRELRAYVRQRESLEQQKVAQINKIGKALQLLNIKLRQVVSKLELQVSMDIIRAIVGGERDTKKLAEFHDFRMKETKEVLAKSLEGNWKREHLFSLKQALTCYDFFKDQMALCDVEIERCLDEMNGGDGKSHLKKKEKVRQNDYTFNAKGYLNEIIGTSLTDIDGLDDKTVVTILSETGTDLSKWKTAHHFSSWLGLSPKPKKTGEKTVGHVKTSVAGRAGRAFRSAASSLHQSKSSLGAYYRRMAFRKGVFSAIKATARKISVIFWNMVMNKIPYKKELATTYDAKIEAIRVKNLEKMALKLGYTLQRATL